MKKYKIKKSLTLLFLAVALFLIMVNYSQAADEFITGTTGSDIETQARHFGGTAGADFNMDASIGDVMAAVIKGFIALLGIIFVVLIVIAGNKWMNAGGDEEKVREAKDTIRHAIIGLIIIIAAYAITEFVFTRLPWGTGGPAVGPIT